MNRPLAVPLWRRALTWACICSSVACGALFAQKPDNATLSFRGKATLLRSSFKLAAGHYTGGKGVLILDGGNDRRCTFEVNPGTVIEDLKLHIREGAELTIRQSLLRRCHIYGEPKSTVVIEGSGLDHCELSGFGDSRRGYGSMKLVNTVLAASSCLRAVNWMGLDLQDCMVIDIKASNPFRAAATRSSTLADLARSPSVRYTTFANCTLDPTLFFTTSHCTFSGCTVAGAIKEEATPTPPTGIALPLRWVSGTPALPPAIGPGVKLVMVEEPIPGGFKLEHHWDGSTLTMPEVKPDETATPLLSVLPPDEPTVAKAPNGAPGPQEDPSTNTEAKLKQTFVNGLLVMPLPSGKEAGQVSKMNLTAVPGASYVRFGQNVGPEMETSLREVQKFMRLRHKVLPPEQDMEISFEEKYSGKDGPSAAVACALLIESAMTGKTWDPSFAVTGDLNADGTVQPIGGVGAKIRGATNGACKIVAIPAKNESAASDILVRDGPSPLVKIAVFTLNNFDDAVTLALAERTGPLQEALKEMEVICGVLKRDPRTMPAILKTPQAAARLQAVLAKAPNCLSAKYLLLYSQGRGPTKLTLAGSLQAADSDAQALVAAISRDFSNASKTLGADELGGNLNRLRNLRPLLDQRVWPYVDALVDFGAAVRGALLNPPKTVSRINEINNEIRRAGSSAIAAKEKLLTEPMVREEMGF